MIHRIAYVSAISPEAASRLVSTMEDILVVSSANNARDGITGLLVADGASFAQVLEGPQAAVEACFARIARDPRTREPLVRIRETAEGCSLFRWSMCGLTLSARDDSLLGASPFPFDLMRLAPGALLQHLQSLGLRHGRALDAEHARLLGRDRSAVPHP